MAEDVTMRSVTDGASRMAFTRARLGLAAAAYLAGLVADWELVHFTPHEFIAAGDRVVVLSAVAFRHRGTGKVAESPKADVFRVRGGRVVEFFDTARALAATRPDEPPVRADWSPPGGRLLDRYIRDRDGRRSPSWSGGTPGWSWAPAAGSRTTTRTRRTPSKRGPLGGAQDRHVRWRGAGDVRPGGISDRGRRGRRGGQLTAVGNDVFLTFTPLPEPGWLLAGVAGMGSIGYLRRLRRRELR
jgi:ketosteroid isomerase-like protein